MTSFSGLTRTTPRIQVPAAAGRKIRVTGLLLEAAHLAVVVVVTAQGEGDMTQAGSAAMAHVRPTTGARSCVIVVKRPLSKSVLVDDLRLYQRY